MAKKTVAVENELARGLNSEGKKTLFCTLWALHGYNAFPRQLREEYIECLWDDNPGSKKDIKKKELLTTNDANEVLQKVLAFDENLIILKNLLRALNSCHRKLSDY